MTAISLKNFRFLAAGAAGAAAFAMIQPRERGSLTDRRILYHILGRRDRLSRRQFRRRSCQLRLSVRSWQLRLRWSCLVACFSHPTLIPVQPNLAPPGVGTGEPIGRLGGLGLGSVRGSEDFSPPARQLTSSARDRASGPHSKGHHPLLHRRRASLPRLAVALSTWPKHQSRRKDRVVPCAAPPR